VVYGQQLVALFFLRELSLRWWEELSPVSSGFPRGHQLENTVETSEADRFHLLPGEGKAGPEFKRLVD
jgi:hypothetical protein